MLQIKKSEQQVCWKRENLYLVFFVNNRAKIFSFTTYSMRLHLNKTFKTIQPPLDMELQREKKRRQ